MAEYKNGFNYRGNMSVDKEDYSPDVQTGRAVFVDEDKYTNDASYKAKVDKCVEEGFHRISEGDTPSGGGGGTEPLMINRSSIDGGKTYYDKTFNDVSYAFMGQSRAVRLNNSGAGRLGVVRMLTSFDVANYTLEFGNLTLKADGLNGSLYSVR